MSYYEIAEHGIRARLGAIPEVGFVYHGEPAAVDKTPFVYYLFEDMDRNEGARIVANTYVVMVRALVKFQEPQAAERELAVLVNAIPHTFNTVSRDDDGHAYATLGGRCNITRVMRAQSGEFIGFHTVSGVLFRSATFRLEIVEKGPAGSGI